jgi:hypothetical protein
MGLRDLIKATERGWDVYESGTVVDKASPAYQTVVEEQRMYLKASLMRRKTLRA